ncbi:hypothetical protein [Micromonospora sp. NPDC049171]
MMLEWGAERLHFTVEGAGPALLFLHGLGGPPEIGCINVGTSQRPTA